MKYDMDVSVCLWERGPYLADKCASLRGRLHRADGWKSKWNCLPGIDRHVRRIYIPSTRSSARFTHAFLPGTSPVCVVIRRQFTSRSPGTSWPRLGLSAATYDNKWCKGPGAGALQFVINGRRG